jgi:glycosyltransferase involved in cell wall biosynthesis
MRVRFVFDIPNIRAFDPKQPNPGVGGTTYAGLYLASLLSNKFDVTIYSRHNVSIPGVQVKDRSLAAAEASAEDVLIYPLSTHSGDLNLLPGRHFPWLHNISDPKLDEVYQRAEKIILVGRQQLDLLRWHRASPKMRVIENPFDASLFPQSLVTAGHIVYLGALNRAKGFHYYAPLIGRVLNDFDLTLHVIGSSKTYGIEGEGELGHSDAQYEKQFLPYVKTYIDSGRILFRGNMGLERLPLIASAKIALINPTGQTETFGYSALECLASGVPVMGGYHKGLIDTLYPDQNFVLNRTREIEPKLRAFLTTIEDHSLRTRCATFAASRSNYQSVAERWEQIIYGIDIARPPISPPYRDPMKLASILIDLTGLRTDFSTLRSMRRRVQNVVGKS